MRSSPVALITGSARRLGAAMARALHARDFRVTIHYRSSRDEAEALASELNAQRSDSAQVACADLGDASACRSLIEDTIRWHGRLDALINNASSFYPTPIETLTPAQWDDLMASNLRAPMFLAAAAAPQLRANRGCIVNITDIHADHPLKDHPVYCAAKAGLSTLTRCLARDLGPEVRVNAVAPGAILWPESDAGATEELTKEQRSIIEGTELKRAGNEQDIASAVCYFVLDAPYVTGQILAVDGGRTIGP